MLKKPNISGQRMGLKDLVQGMQYLMLSSLDPEQPSTNFYAVFDQIDDAQYQNIQRGSACFGLDAFIVECTFKADTTIVLCNPREPEATQSITLELDAYGNGHPVNKHLLQ